MALRALWIWSGQPGGVPPHQLRPHGLNLSNSMSAVRFCR
jgi:hypothetical protein